jgi:alpha-beta hydrolase superfamily lysophospholipase
MRSCAQWLLIGMIGSAAVQAQAPAAKVPKPRELSLTTGDGVEIVATYYATEKGKETIPVILLHEYGGKGEDYKALALFLQSKDFAVLVPDLRGHGGSTKVRGGKELDHKKMPPKLCHAIYAKDGEIDVCKAFLIKENNQEKLNIDKLCVVGSELGATLAMNWAIVDWAWPVLGGVKQGQDIKAIAMLSPSFSEKTVTATMALRAPVVQKELAIYIAVGETGKGPEDAKKIHKPLDTARGGTEKEEIEKGLLMHTFPTNRQGTQLLGDAKLQIAGRIEQFFTATVGKRNLPWKERKSPFE